MPAPLVAPLVIAGVSALGKIGTGIGQLIGANKKSKNNIRPTFDIQQEYFDNRDIAARTAQGGLTESSLDFYEDMAGRGLSTSTDALLQAGAGVNTINKTFDTYLQGGRSIAAEDSQLQQKNILTYLDRNDTLAKQKVQKWVIDKYEPFKDTAEAAAKERSAGAQNIFGGLAEGTGAASAYSTSKLYEDLLRTPERTNATQGQPATAQTTWYTDKPSDMYGDFVDPYEVTPVQQRVEQARAEINPEQYSQEQLDIIKQLLKPRV
jgi:hypothetical protein